MLDEYDNTPDVIDEKPAADPMAKARAAKAKKALEQAEAEAKLAEQQAAPVANKQPTVSTLRIKTVEEDAGPLVWMRITVEGHGQISTGGEHGFERYAMDAEVQMRELYARQNFKKHWAEPIDRDLVKKWKLDEQREFAAAVRRKASYEHVMEHGVAAGENWSAGV